MIEEIMNVAGTQAAPKNSETIEPKNDIPAWAQELMKQNEEMRSKIKMFEDLAGKNEITSYMDRQRDFSKKFVHFKKFNGKIVIAWSNLDYSKFNPSVKDGLLENVTTTVTYLDGKQEKINFILLDRQTDMIKVPIVEMGTELVKVEWPSDVVDEYKLADKVMSVEIKYVNR